MSFARGWGKDGDSHRREDDFVKSMHAFYKINRHKYRMIKIKKIFNDSEKTK